MPRGVAVPELLGEVHAALLTPAVRRAGGVHLTPPSVAARLAAVTLGRGEGNNPVRVADPACGGGALLLAAARHLGRQGRRLHAVACDIDPVAVEVTDTALWLAGVDRRCQVADALLDPWPAMPPLDAVLANPPFLGQLRRDTAADPERRSALRHRFGEAAAGYADVAGLFLLTCLEQAPGARVGIILPRSLLSARWAAEVRRRTAAASQPEWLWLLEADAFDGIAARPMVLVLGPRDLRPPPRLRVQVGSGVPRAGRRLDQAAWDAGRWGVLTAPRRAPAVVVRHRLGEVAAATADFREAFYALTATVVEGGAGWPVVTSGAVDPGRLLWGRRRIRLGGRLLLHPVVPHQVIATHPFLGTWSRRRLVPKVLVATQTRCLEAAVDAEGRVLPCTPVISVTAAPRSLWHVAAALTNPVACDWVLERTAGSGLATGTMRPAARDLVRLPVPPAGRHWDAAAGALAASAPATSEEGRREALVRCAEHMCRAHGVPPALAEGWATLLPRDVHRQAV